MSAKKQRSRFTDFDGDTFTVSHTTGHVSIGWEGAGTSIVIRSEDAPLLAALLTGGDTEARVKELADVIAAEFKEPGESIGQVITRFQNAEIAARKIVARQEWEPQEEDHT